MLGSNDENDVECQNVQMIATSCPAGNQLAHADNVWLQKLSCIIYRNNDDLMARFLPMDKHGREFIPNEGQLPKNMSRFQSTKSGVRNLIYNRYKLLCNNVMQNVTIL